MAEFLTGILALPTVLFTGALGVAVAYWLFVVAGFFSMDFLDGVLGLDGADAAIDGRVLETPTVAAGKTALAGAGEAADTIDGSAPRGGLLGVMAPLGLRGIPITVTLSFVTLGCWLLSFGLMQLIGASVRTGLMAFIVAVSVAAVSFALSLLATSVLLRPFQRFFVFDHGRSRASLVGKLCTLTSSRVDARSGQAEIDDGGSGFVAEVRCGEANALGRGDRALVFRYDAENEVFHVAPLDEALK